MGLPRGLFTKSDEIEISNSLHKFHRGNNYTDFSLSEIEEAIYTICEKFDIEPKEWELKKLEFGFNVITTRPAKDYLDLFLECKNRAFEKMKANHIYYGRKCFMSEYALKVYDKHIATKKMDNMAISNKILRIEFCYNQKRKLPKQIKTLSDLLDKDKFKDLYKDLEQAISKVIISDESDFSTSTNAERLLFYASLNPNFIKVEERINKVEAKAMKPKIRQLKERFLKKEFKQWLLKALRTKYIELYCN